MMTELHNEEANGRIEDREDESCETVEENQNCSGEVENNSNDQGERNQELLGETESTDREKVIGSELEETSRKTKLEMHKSTQNGPLSDKPSSKKTTTTLGDSLLNATDSPGFVSTTTSSEKLDKNARRNIEAATKSMLKALSQLESPEEKIAALCSRYADLLSEHKQLQNFLKDSSKQHQQLQKEKDRLQVDHNKTLLAKERLESLCRELQKQNKQIKEESLKRSLEEQTRIREVSDRFQTTITEVQSSMSENTEKNEKLKEENQELCGKMKNLLQQYEKREEYVEVLTKTKDMERQLVEARLKETTMMLAEEREHNLVEKQKLLSDNVEMRQRCETLVAQLEASKTKDKMYADKFDEFESTLTKSNDMFTTFKQEMDKTTKRIKFLEKETQMWKSKFDGANQSLIKIMEERIAKEKELLASVSKTQKLEKLCRALQEERNSLNEKNRKFEREINHLKIKMGDFGTGEEEDHCEKQESRDQGIRSDLESKQPGQDAQHSEDDVSTSEVVPSTSDCQPAAGEPSS